MALVGGLLVGVSILGENKLNWIFPIGEDRLKYHLLALRFLLKIIV